MSRSVVSDSFRPHGLYVTMPGSSVRGILQARILEWRYWREYYSLLQEIVPTQGSNPGLLHCRWILYQLSYQAIPGCGGCGGWGVCRIEILTEVASGHRFPKVTGRPPRSR